MVTSLIKKIRHLFVPHESNNFKARLLHNSFVAVYILVLLFFQTSTNILKSLKPNILGYATDISVERILTLVNQKRTEANLPPLQLSDLLTTAAIQKAQDMFAKNYWAHVSPTGTSPWVFITNSGYEYIYAGENLARNFNTSQEVVDAWINSPTHRANILKPEYSDIGLAVLNGRLNGEETTLVVQEFGKRSVALAEKPKTFPTSPPIKTSDQNQLESVKSSSDNIVIARNQDTNRETTKKSLIPYPFLNKTVSLLIAEFLLIVLFIDSIYLWKFKTSRLSSHNLAHIIFLGALIGAMGATGIGVIL